jgi:hypothetical protein
VLSVHSERIGLYSLCKKIPRLLFPTFTTLIHLGLEVLEQNGKSQKDAGLLSTRALTATNGQPRLKGSSPYKQ